MYPEEPIPFVLDDSTELPWPEMGETVFVYDESSPLTVSAKVDKWTLYTESYMEASHFLIKHVLLHINDERNEQLIFPIVFLFRHHVELRIKSIILSAKWILSKNDSSPKGHHLEKLWAVCRPLLEQIWLNKYSDQYDAVGDYIAQLCKIDPESQAFRYPQDLKGKDNLPDFKGYDIGVFQDTMGKLYMFLASVELALLGIGINRAKK